ncbi:hypothetical protein COP2_035766 [Malus domestica]
MSLTKFCLRFTKDEHTIQTNKENHSRRHVATIKILRPSGGSTVGSLGSRDPLEAMEATFETPWRWWGDPWCDPVAVGVVGFLGRRTNEEDEGAVRQF